MKLRFPIAFALTILTAGFFLLTGCASVRYGHIHAIRLKIVDAKYGDPISGVTGTWREDQDDMLYGASHLGPASLPPSNDKGEITIATAHEKTVGRFILTRDGYVTLYGVYNTDGSLNVSREIQPPPFPQDVFEIDDARAITPETDGSYTVRMPK
jgi:hypothetical protein